MAGYIAEWLSFIPPPDRWIVSISIAFVFSYAVSILLKKLEISEMVGEIIAGIILGIPVIKAGLLDDKAISVIGSLGEIGALLLLALAGLEIELDKIRKASKEGAAIATLSFALPFIMGYAYTVSLGYSWKGAFVVGIVLGVTAEEIATKVYIELGVLNSRIGAVTLLAAVVDDVVEVIGLAIALALIEAESFHVAALRLPIYAVIYLAVSYAISKASVPLLKRYRPEGYERLWLYLVFLFLYSALGAIFQLGPVIGAILGGFFLQYSARAAFGDDEDLLSSHEKTLETLERIILGFLVPFFFVLIGLEFNVKYLVQYPVELIVITLIAFLGKIGGTMLAKPFTTLSWRQLWFVGWAMNARGTLGMILSLIALRYNLIGPELYTTIVAMAMITTITFPFVVKAEYERDRTIVD